MASSLVIVFVLSTFALTTTAAHSATTVTINGATKYQAIDGFGASSEAFGQTSSIQSSSAGRDGHIKE